MAVGNLWAVLSQLSPCVVGELLLLHCWEQPRPLTGRELQYVVWSGQFNSRNVEESS